ncbi:hypothetical protein [Psychrobacter sp.]
MLTRVWSPTKKFTGVQREFLSGKTQPMKECTELSNTTMTGVTVTPSR